jgi:translation elongation factor EF-Ts
MMDCKKALVEAEGDFDKAIQNLREKGQKVAANRSDRESSEGAAVSFINADKTKGAIITLNCETDFVGKNEAFVTLAKELVEKATDDENEGLLHDLIDEGEYILSLKTQSLDEWYDEDEDDY